MAINFKVPEMTVKITSMVIEGTQLSFYNGHELQLSINMTKDTERVCIDMSGLLRLQFRSV